MTDREKVVRAVDTSVCVNDASDHLVDFVLPDDVCEEWEENDAKLG